VSNGEAGQHLSVNLVIFKFDEQGFSEIAGGSRIDHAKGKAPTIHKGSQFDPVSTGGFHHYQHVGG